MRPKLLFMTNLGTETYVDGIGRIDSVCGTGLSNFGLRLSLKPNLN